MIDKILLDITWQSLECLRHEFWTVNSQTFIPTYNIQKLFKYNKILNRQTFLGEAYDKTFWDSFLMLNETSYV